MSLARGARLGLYEISASPIRLGSGEAQSLSPDGRRAIAIAGGTAQSGSRLVLLSAGAEPLRELQAGTLDSIAWAQWTPDGQQVILTGSEKDRPLRSYIQRPPDGQAQAICREGHCA